jgi:hypothetical protein
VVGKRPLWVLSPAPCQQGGHEVPFLGAQFGRHRRIHAAMDGMQPARAEGAIDRRPVDFSGQQLCPVDNAVLPTGNGPNRFGFSSVSDGKAKRLGHAAWSAPPPRRLNAGFATTQPKKRRTRRAPARCARPVVIRLR